MPPRKEGEEEQDDLALIAERVSAVYAQLLSRSVPNREAEFNCGKSYLAAERPDLAEDVFRRLLECGYKPTSSRFQLVQSLYAQGRYVDCKIELKKLLEDDPDHAEARDFLDRFQNHVNREGKIALYGVLGVGALLALYCAYRKSVRNNQGS